MRWHPKILAFALHLHRRGKSNYEQLVKSDFLILPSGSTIQRYKNRVKRYPGINEEGLKWMHKCANPQNLQPRERCGMLLYNEMKIQDGLVISTRNGKITLIGYVYMSESLNNLDCYVSQNVTAEYATHVVQFMFLGFNGFRFPICHCPVKSLRACHLHLMIWRLINELKLWDFSVSCVLQDGGCENRNFIKDTFQGQSPNTHKWAITNPANPKHTIFLVQDYSHNLEKMRNDLINSGTEHFHTRNIVLNGFPIQWKMWLDAATWDMETNCHRLCQFEQGHLHPTAKQKMWNYLAKDVLDSKTKYLMECYQNTLNDDKQSIDLYLCIRQKYKI